MGIARCQGKKYQGPAGSGEVITRGTDGQCCVQYTLLLAEVIGEALDLCRRGADENHFSAQIVVEVDVGSRQDRVIIMVLQLNELFAELEDMMVIDQGHRPQGFLLRAL